MSYIANPVAERNPSLEFRAKVFAWLFGATYIIAALAAFGPGVAS